MNIVTNMRTLRKLEKLNLIRLHPHTGTKVYWNGSYSTCHYIDDYVTSSVFVYNRTTFEVRYFSGCFYPYVTIKHTIN